jgi:membrane-bound lytic murein transglycosylase D
MKRITFVIAVIIMITSKLFAQIDTLTEKQTLSNIDSLLNSYYVKTSINKYDKNKTVFTDNHNIDVPDSVIIERLNKLASPIQLTYNPIVRNWINLYLKRGKYMLPTIMGLSEYYFPMFEAQLDAKGLPLELKYLPIIESALNPRAVSRAGATGIWQFIYATGRRYNLEINSYVDERKDPQKATEAAVAYLSDLYDIFHDWTLALAAYNCGAINVNKAISRSGGKTNFWEIYKYLPRETRGYIPAFIAMTYIMNYPEEHNLYPAQIDLPINTDTVMITDTLHLIQVAEVIDIPLEQLRDLNPQYQRDIIPGFIKPYPLRLPIEKISAFLMNEDKIYNYKDSLIFSKPVVVTTPPAYSNRRHYYQPEPCPKYNFAGKGKVYYTVKSGDNLSFIAEWFDVSVRDIKCWNNLKSTRLNLGQKLVIYEPLKKISYYQQMNSLNFEQKQEKASTRKQKSQNLNPNYIYYTIKSGDNIYTIAEKYDGVTYQDIMKINNFSDNDVSHLQIGQVIKIKRKN